MFVRAFRLLLSPDAVESGSTTSDADKGRTADPDAFQKLLDKKNGDASALAFMLWNENADARRKNAELRDKIPPAGSVVLTGDDARAWDGYRGLGKPEDLRKVVKEHGEVTAKVAAFEREKTVGEFGRKAGVPADKIALLARLAGSVAFEEKAEKVDGKDTTTVLVRDGDAEPVPFDSYFADALPALKPDARTAPPPKGTPPRGTAPRAEFAQHGGPTDPVREELLTRAGHRYAPL